MKTYYFACTMSLLYAPAFLVGKIELYNIHSNQDQHNVVESRILNVIKNAGLVGSIGASWPIAELVYYTYAAQPVLEFQDRSGQAPVSRLEFLMHRLYSHEGRKSLQRFCHWMVCAVIAQGLWLRYKGLSEPSAPIAPE